MQRKTAEGTGMWHALKRELTAIVCGLLGVAALAFLLGLADYMERTL
jgi:hypothetical protein